MQDVYAELAELKCSVLMMIAAADGMINNRSAHIIWLESFRSCCRIYSVKQWSALEPFVVYVIAGRYLPTEENTLSDLFDGRTPDFSTEREQTFHGLFLIFYQFIGRWHLLLSLIIVAFSSQHFPFVTGMDSYSDFLAR